MKRIKQLFSAVMEGKSTYRSTLDLSDARVDREKGIIKGVSLVSEGEARGHKQFADRKTLDQVLACAKEYTGGLRVKFNPLSFDHGPGSLAGRIPGESMRIKGKQVVGDLHIYESYPQRDYIFEIAETAPDNFGLSIEFNGVPEELDGKRFARCDEIFAATIVDIPAANATGLFRQGDDENDGEQTMKQEEITKLFKDGLAEALAPVTKQLNELRAKVDNPATGSASAEEKAAAGVTVEDTEEVAQEKVSAYRLKLNKDKPATVGDVLQIFRMTGGKPAKVSGDGTSAGDGDEADKGKGTLTGFKARIKRYEGAGMKEGKAILRAKEDDPKGYNKFAKATGDEDPDPTKK